MSTVPERSLWMMRCAGCGGAGKIGEYVPTNHEDTHLDEVVGWSLALVGVYVQFSLGFSLPLPFNLLLLPFSIAEYVVQWQVTY